MTSADDEDVDAQAAMMTTRGTTLWSEGTTQLQLHIDAAAKSPPVVRPR
jgi:hypothetical protein